VNTGEYTALLAAFGPMLYALCPASTTQVNPWSGPKDRSLKPTKMKAKDSFARLPTEQESTLSRVVSENNLPVCDLRWYGLGQ